MDVWAENEFGAAALGRALVKRMVKSVRIQSMAPSKTFFSAACGDQAAVTGYHRMIERPEEGGFTPEAVLSAHRERTLKRMRGAETALLIQDGTDLNFATRGGCSGLGVISRTKGAAGTLGIHMHSTFAVNGNGLPLGVPRIEFDCPDGKADKGKPPEERKSARWLRGWRDASELAAAAPGTRTVSVMDREGDIAALFAERQADGGAELLVRAKHDRAFPDGESLFTRMRNAPPDGEHGIRIDRASPRRAARGQKGFAGREARRATAQLRWQALEVPVPRAAVEVLDLYALRWRIEDWHRILKSGCGRGEDGPQHGGADQAGGRAERGDRVAPLGADAARAGHAGAAGRKPVREIGNRDAAGLCPPHGIQPALPGEPRGNARTGRRLPRGGGAAGGPARRIPEPEE